MTNNIQLTQPELDTALDATDAAANTSVSKIYTALGHILQSINATLENDPALRDELEQHLIVIDEESRSLQSSVTTLTAEMTALAAFANEIRKQRDDMAWELKDSNDRLDEAEHSVQSRLYMDMLSNIQVHFNCSRKVANQLLDAIWDINDPISSRAADLLDSIAHTVSEADWR